MKKHELLNCNWTGCLVTAFCVLCACARTHHKKRKHEKQNARETMMASNKCRLQYMNVFVYYIMAVHRVAIMRKSQNGSEQLRAEPKRSRTPQKNENKQKRSWLLCGVGFAAPVHLCALNISLSLASSTTTLCVDIRRRRRRSMEFEFIHMARITHMKEMRESESNCDM